MGLPKVHCDIAQPKPFKQVVKSQKDFRFSSGFFLLVNDELDLPKRSPSSMNLHHGLGSDPQNVGIRSPKCWNQIPKHALRFEIFVRPSRNRKNRCHRARKPPLPTIVGRHKCTLPNSCKHSIYNSHNSVGVALVSFSGTKMVQVDSLSSFCPVVSVDRAQGLLGKYSGSA